MRSRNVRYAMVVTGAAALLLAVCSAQPQVTRAVEPEAYPWLAELGEPLDRLELLSQRLPAPSGFERAPVQPRSFAAWLRDLPVWRDRTDVHSWRGRSLQVRSPAVIALDTGRGDLQQCADSILRLHAEYRWHRGQRQQLAYHLTSGDRISWHDWLAGERLLVDGSRVERTVGAARAADHRSFRAWLQQLFIYAGTRSLRYDTAPVPPQQPAPAGDILVDPGSPGHAVIVLDVAENADGRRLALIGQGFMPAQELHVISGNAANAADGIWFELPSAGGELRVPSWPAPFTRSDLRRFPTH
jgi:hypothetical protein